jgi:hypothetical protein
MFMGWSAVNKPICKPLKKSILLPVGNQIIETKITQKSLSEDPEGTAIPEILRKLNSIP